MKMRILVADDSTDWSKPFCEFLRRRGFNAKSVATGQELYDRIVAEQDDYDVLIVDNSMPASEGGEEIPFCGVLQLGRLVLHFEQSGTMPEILNHAIVRSIYSQSDIQNLCGVDNIEVMAGCKRVAAWFDRSVPLDTLMTEVVQQLNNRLKD